MTVMSTGVGVVLHLPIPLVSGEGATIDRLGRVHAMIAPNLYLHEQATEIFAAAWMPFSR